MTEPFSRMARLRRMVLVAIVLSIAGASVAQATGWQYVSPVGAEESGDGPVPLEATVMLYVSLCHGYGGTATIFSSEDRTATSGNSGYTIECKGTFLNFFCIIDAAGAMCTFGFSKEPQPLDVPLPSEAEQVPDQPVTTPGVADEQVAPGGVDAASLYDPQATYGESIDPRADLVIEMCRNLGGSETALLSPGVGGEMAIDTFICNGGLFDTLGCSLGDTAAWCALGLEELPVREAAQPEGAVLLPADVPQIEIPAVTDVAGTPGVVDEPATGGETVIYSQHGATVDERAAGQRAFCELFGGTVERNHDHEHGIIDTKCHGGLLDGFYCTNGEITLCAWMRVQASPTIVVTPVPAQEQPVDLAPSPTPTEPATAPTPTATAEPTPTATAEPTAPPPTVVFPTAPGGNDVPPGGGNEQPPEPTPTPHIIT